MTNSTMYRRYYEEIVNYLVYGTFWPDASESEKHVIQKRASKYRVINGILYHKGKGRGVDDLRYVPLTGADQLNAIRICHTNEENDGHYGINKTASLLSSKFYWRMMFTDVIKFVKKCPICKELNNVQWSFLQEEEKEKANTWKLIEIDILENFHSTRKNVFHVARLVDVFSNWTSYVPLTDLNEKSIVRGVLKEFAVVGFPLSFRFVNAKSPSLILKALQNELVSFSVIHMAGDKSIDYSVHVTMEDDYDNGQSKPTVDQYLNQYQEVLDKHKASLYIFFGSFAVAIEAIQTFYIEKLREFCKEYPYTWSNKLHYLLFSVQNTPPPTMKLSPHSLIFGRSGGLFHPEPPEDKFYDTELMSESFFNLECAPSRKKSSKSRPSPNDSLEEEEEDEARSLDEQEVVASQPATPPPKVKKRKTDMDGGSPTLTEYEDSVLEQLFPEDVRGSPKLSHRSKNKDNRNLKSSLSKKHDHNHHKNRKRSVSFVSEEEPQPTYHIVPTTTPPVAVNSYYNTSLAHQNTPLKSNNPYATHDSSAGLPGYQTPEPAKEETTPGRYSFRQNLKAKGPSSFVHRFIAISTSKRGTNRIELESPEIPAPVKRRTPKPKLPLAWPNFSKSNNGEPGPSSLLKEVLSMKAQPAGITALPNLNDQTWTTQSASENTDVGITLPNKPTSILNSQLIVSNTDKQALDNVLKGDLFSNTVSTSVSENSSQSKETSVITEEPMDTISDRDSETENCLNINLPNEDHNVEQMKFNILADDLQLSDEDSLIEKVSMDIDMNAEQHSDEKTIESGGQVLNFSQLHAQHKDRLQVDTSSHLPGTVEDTESYSVHKELDTTTASTTEVHEEIKTSKPEEISNKEIETRETEIPHEEMTTHKSPESLETLGEVPLKDDESHDQVHMEKETVLKYMVLETESKPVTVHEEAKVPADDEVTQKTDTVHEDMVVSIESDKTHGPEKADEEMAYQIETKQEIMVTGETKPETPQEELLVLIDADETTETEPPTEEIAEGYVVTEVEEQFEAVPAEQFEAVPAEQFEAVPAEQFEAVPAEQFEAVPAEQYEAVPAEQYEAVPAEQYEAVPAEQYEAVPAEQYEAVPAEQYEAVPAEQYEAVPAEQYEAVPAEQYEAVPAEQYEAVPAEQYEAVPAEQYEAVPAEQYEAVPAEQYEAVPAEQYEAVPAEQYEAVPAEQYEAVPAEQYEAVPAEQYEAVPAEQYEAVPAEQFEAVPAVPGEEVEKTTTTIVKQEYFEPEPMIIDQGMDMFVDFNQIQHPDIEDAMCVVGECQNVEEEEEDKIILENKPDYQGYVDKGPLESPTDEGPRAPPAFFLRRGPATLVSTIKQVKQEPLPHASTPNGEKLMPEECKGTKLILSPPPTRIKKEKEKSVLENKDTTPPPRLKEPPNTTPNNLPKPLIIGEGDQQFEIIQLEDDISTNTDNLSKDTSISKENDRQGVSILRPKSERTSEVDLKPCGIKINSLPLDLVRQGMSQSVYLRTIVYNNRKSYYFGSNKLFDMKYEPRIKEAKVVISPASTVKVSTTSTVKIAPTLTVKTSPVKFTPAVVKVTPVPTTVLKKETVEEEIPKDIVPENSTNTTTNTNFSVTDMKKTIKKKPITPPVVEEIKIFKCPVCPKTVLASEGMLNLHLQFHCASEVRNIVCPICSKPGTSWQALLRHYSNHEEGRKELQRIEGEIPSNALCLICRKICPTKEALAQHMQFKHPSNDSGENKSEKSEEKPQKRQNHQANYKCDDCGYSTKVSYNYLMHCEHECPFRKTVRTVKSEPVKIDYAVLQVSEPRFKCEKCKFEGNSAEVLEEHVKNKHPPNKYAKYKCEFCSQRFKTASALNSHVPSHEELMMFSCKLCDYKNKHKSVITRHAKNRHPELPFKQLIKEPKKTWQVAKRRQQREDEDIDTDGGGFEDKKDENDDGEEKSNNGMEEEQDDGIPTATLVVSQDEYGGIVVCDAENDSQLAIDSSVAEPPTATLVIEDGGGLELDGNVALQLLQGSDTTVVDGTETKVLYVSMGTESFEVLDNSAFTIIDNDNAR